MKKNILVFVLALSAFCAVFAAGCTNNPSSAGNGSTGQSSTSGNAVNRTAKDVIVFGEKYYSSKDSVIKYYVFNENNTCTYYYGNESKNLKWVETSDRAIHLFEKYEAGAGISAKDTTRYDENDYIAGPIYYSEDIMVYYRDNSTVTNGSSGYYNGFTRTYYLIRESKLS